MTRLARRTATLLTLLGLVTAALTGTVLEIAGVAVDAYVCAAIAVTFAFVAAAAGVWHRESKGTISQALGGFAVIGVGCSAVNTVNQALHRPFLSDAAGHDHRRARDGRGRGRLDARGRLPRPLTFPAPGRLALRCQTWP